MQESTTQAAVPASQGDEHSHGGSLLGPLLCWAVVFADIGTSVYYTPGILYGTVGKLAGFFVFLTMSVFVLLTLKYAEVTHRFPQGGGVVTVAAHAMNHWFGALGGMFILVDYFLTASISCLSGILYFSVVFPALSGPALWITVGVLVLLGILNWVGISESAKVSFVGAVIAFCSDIAILVTVFSHLSLGQVLALFPAMFAAHTVTPVSLLIGFGGSFLAFSGLESISQLSPVMKTPRKKVASIALLLVVVTVGLTSPLLTMFSTILQPDKAANAATSTQLISLLAGHWGNVFLQTEVAISASALLIFASNTAIIGSYHVFMALARMEFFPAFVLQRNRLRGTPHYSIMLATGIPIIVLVAVGGRIDILGDMYAFGLLGAFTLTCLGLDILRYRERKAQRHREEEDGHGTTSDQHADASDGHRHGTVISTAARTRTGIRGFWYTLDFWLGVLTTGLVAIAWTTNLVAKPLATAFGGTVALLGMGAAYLNYRSHEQRGYAPVSVTNIQSHMHDSTLAILTANNPHNEQVIRSAIQSAAGHPLVFLYVGEPTTRRAPEMFEFVDPYLDDTQAKKAFGKAESLARKAGVQIRQFVYRQNKPGTVGRVWQIVHPHDTVVAAEELPQTEDINPDRISYEVTPGTQIAHMVKRW